MWLLLPHPTSLWVPCSARKRWFRNIVTNWHSKIIKLNWGYLFISLQFHFCETFVWNKKAFRVVGYSWHPTPLLMAPSHPPNVDCERDKKKLLSHLQHYPPDVWCISRNVILASRIKGFFCPFHSRFYSLVLSPQFPPRGIVILLSDLTTENLPSPLVDQESKRQKSDFAQSHLHQGVYVRL